MKKPQDTINIASAAPAPPTPPTGNFPPKPKPPYDFSDFKASAATLAFTALIVAVIIMGSKMASHKCPSTGFTEDRWLSGEVYSSGSSAFTTVGESSECDATLKLGGEYVRYQGPLQLRPGDHVSVKLKTEFRATNGYKEQVRLEKIAYISAVPKKCDPAQSANVTFTVTNAATTAMFIPLLDSNGNAFMRIGRTTNLDPAPTNGIFYSDVKVGR